jgi:DNA-binding SARP family transcriptional activator/tetratricopeptide (TPR) repeat protein
MTRVLLGMLAMRVNQPVTTEWITEGLWPSAAPKSAPANIRSHVADLRGLLPPDIQILATGRGYLLRAAVDAVDVTLFQRLVRDGRRYRDAGAHHAAVDSLSRAITLWRGPLMEGVSVPDILASEAAALEDQRLTALEDTVDVRLALGQHDELTPLLRGLVVDHAFRERFWGQLMLVLHRTGRSGEAADTYHRVRQLLHDELGTEPDPHLSDLHRRIRRNDPALASDGRPVVPKGNQSIVPRQLPADIVHLVGRGPALSELDTALTGGTLGIVTGLAGVGKTALAVRWSHCHADRFPDGQLYRDVRGTAPELVLPAELVLAGFLRALGVPAGDIPTDLSEATALYRSVLADRKVLIVLDNVARADQVRALRPAGPGCALLVTSRHRLSSLVAYDDARRIELAPLDASRSTDLLSRIIGVRRTTTELPAARRIAELCGHLPLALRIAAARLCDAPTVPLRAFVAQLGRSPRLDTLTIDDDQSAGIRAAFELSYQALSGSAQSIFRLFGLLPGTDISEHAIGAMAGVSTTATHTALTELTEAHLVSEQHPTRFAMHDLVAAYARERAASELTETARRAAVGAGLEWYLRTGLAAAELAQPQLVRLALSPAAATSATLNLSSTDDAAAWLNTESDNIVAAIAAVAEDAEHGRYAWLLADMMQGQFRTQLTLTQWHDAVHAGLSAARQAGDDLAIAAMLRSTGTMLLKTGDRTGALANYEQALVRYAALDRPADLCAVHNNVGMALAEEQRLAESEQALRHALAAAERIGDPTRIGTVLANLATVTDPNNLGWLAQSVAYATRAIDLARQAHEPDKTALFGQLITRSEALRALGEHAAAAANRAEAIAIATTTPHMMTRPAVLDQLANAHRADGRPDHALDFATKALVVVHRRGSASEQAAVHNTVGRVLADLGHYDDARRHFHDALAVARTISDKQAEVQAFLGIAADHETRGEPTEAARVYQRALRIATEGAMSVVQADLHLALARLIRAGPDRTGAQRHLEQARAASAHGYHSALMEANRLDGTVTDW